MSCWPQGLDYRYDRRPNPDFLALFQNEGPLQVLTEYARKAPYPVDLQFRRDLKTDEQRATVYVGTEKVLDVHWRRGTIRLQGHRRHGTADFGYRVGWEEWRDAADAAGWMPDVELYLDAVIPPVAGGGAGVEGAVQSAVSSFDSADRAMLDREFTLQFKDATTRRAVMSDVTRDLVRVAASAPVRATAPTGFGGECDLLSVDADGRLLAIEVKPRRASTIPWAPLQVIVYTRLIRRWLRDDPLAVEILRDVAEQRQRLGLLTSKAAAVSQAAPVVPPGHSAGDGAG